MQLFLQDNAVNRCSRDLLFTRGLSFARKPIARCALLLIVFFACNKQMLRAQTGTTTSNHLPSAEKIVQSYLKTIGGKKRIASIRDATYEWEIQLKERSMGIAKTQMKFPASVRAQLTFGNGEIVSAANPRSAWIYGLDGRVHTLTDAEAAAARLQAGLDASHLLDIKKRNVLARIVSLRTGAADSAYVVEFSLRSGARLRYLFSPTTKLLIGIEDDARNTTTRFGDYRSEGSILEAHRMNVDIRGSGELTFLLKRVTYNAGIADAVFDPPQPAEALDVPALLREVSRNQDQLEQRFTEYSFIQKETAREISSKGEIKKETVKVFEVFPIANRKPVMKLISENGFHYPASAQLKNKSEWRMNSQVLNGTRTRMNRRSKGDTPSGRRRKALTRNRVRMTT
ncbi:MAG TPA: hypothetical protein VMZ30_20395 [Pyrinomonadaceae bacterium]|nr:hypothetical protein [Pyrinomonadaceae bacterium]